MRKGPFPAPRPAPGRSLNFCACSIFTEEPSMRPAKAYATLGRGIMARLVIAASFVTILGLAGCASMADSGSYGSAGYYGTPEYYSPGYYSPSYASLYGYSPAPYAYGPGWASGQDRWREHERHEHLGGPPHVQGVPPAGHPMPMAHPTPPPAPPAAAGPQVEHNRKLLDQLGFRPSH